MNILVINAGSSSLKYQVFDMNSGKVIAKGLCDRIGIDGTITHKRPGKENYKAEVALASHDDAISLVLKLLVDPELGVLSNVSEIGAVGHRFAHGGEQLKTSTVLGEKEKEYLYSIVGINPLHGPPAIKGLEACQKLLPNVKHVGVFDTSFYSQMPASSYVYPIPYEYYEKYRVRRYGFHGTSHRYVSGKAAEYLGKDLKDLKMITCHLGNGSSISAIKNGVCVDTSMGFTPQEGLPMGTRSGTIDPTVPTYLMDKLGISPKEMDDILNRKSGLLGLSGISSDCREVMIAEAQGNERAHLTMEVFYHYIVKIIGSYAAEMDGLDVVVFTAGIGENDAVVRSNICSRLGFLGIKINDEINRSTPRGEFCDFSAEGSAVKSLCIPTDEEYMIALDTYRIANA
ncbi:MAG: acetate kinase [Clostridia bacterium]|nr:acetate kinase [Clostridia bacterium]MBO7150747.1 acetate kinase [Clostridia bacterium]